MSRKRDKLYTCWWNMIRRCTDERNSRYERYGGRGIKVCDEWLNDFQSFKTWALENGHEEGLTLDREDNDGNYEPSNCRWATAKQQANNTCYNRIVKYKGITGTLTEICELFNKDYGLVNGRIQKGWSVAKSLNTPLNGYTSRNHLLTYKGVTKSVADWNRELGFSKNTLSERIRSGMSVEEALTKPLRKRRKTNGSK